MILKGKIIKILDQYKVLANIGADSGIKRGMDFIIYSQGETVKDPESQEVLGKLENVKARIKVSHIQEKFSILESSETETRTLPGIKAWFDLLAAGLPRTETVRKPLPLEVKPEPKGEPERTVKIGDLVRQDIS